MPDMTLRELRRRAGMTQEQLETASGLSQTAISLLETGRVRDPAYSTVAALAAALKKTPVEIAAAIEASEAA
jgi:transcriptional regulator with XRE-family HTH domain